MKTSHIEDIVKEYLGVDQTQYALLINGTWGSGKTFFWKRTLTETVVSQELKPIYLSLNGLSTVEQLQQQLMVKLIPFFGKSEHRILKNVLRLTGNVGTAAAKIFKVDLSEIMSGVTLDGFKFKDKVVCFDDLERCQIPIKELLGFINDFVEHRNLKCIILADAVKINDNTHYLDIKEKVIGRELNYEPELEAVLPKLYGIYSDDLPFTRFLTNHRDYIFGLFYEYKEYNLRIISFFLESLCKIYNSFKDVDPQFQKEVILFTAIVSIEFKRGMLTSKEIDDSQGLKDVTYLRFQSIGDRSSKTFNFKNDDKEQTEVEPTYKQIFYLKYVEHRLVEFRFYGSIYRYILSGYLDTEKLVSELEERKPEIQSQEVKAFERLIQYDFRSISSDDFEDLVSEVLQNAADGKYTIYDYDRLSNFYHFFSKSDLTDKTPNEIDIILSKGLSIAAERKEINYKIFDNLAHFGVSMPEMQPIRDQLKCHHAEIAAELEALDSNILIEILENEDIDGFNQLFEEKKYSGDFFKYINGQELFETLKSTSNATLCHFTKAMRTRYKSHSLLHIYPHDYVYLKELNDSIDRLSKAEQIYNKLRKFNWSELQIILERACELLKPAD